MATPLVEPALELTNDEVRRYERHLVLPDMGLTGQKRLKNARVLVIGAGGLGSPALLYLAAAGVGTLGIIDFDVVEESNLQRQVIHGQSDIGTPKTKSAADSIAEVNPFVEVVLHETRLEASNALQIFAEYDVIVDGTDNFATRYLANDAAAILGKPYVWGSIYRFEGRVSVFWAKEGPQYRDLYPEPPPAGMVPSCAEGGVLGVLCATIGSLMGTEAIKLITGIGEPLIGRIVIYDALDTQFATLPVQRNPEQPIRTTLLSDYDAFCAGPSKTNSSNNASSTITVSELERLLKARETGERQFVLLDVREPYERQINHIPGSMLVPPVEFRDGSAIEKLPRDTQLVLYCKSGGRSADALAILHAAGFDDAIHVAGGVTEWVAQIDPTQAKY